MEENKKSIVSKFFSGKGFYMILAACLVAVGVAAWSAVTAIQDFTATESYPDEPQSYISSETSIPNEPVQNEVSDLPYEAPESEPEASDTTPVADYFVMPVSGDIEKGFDEKTLQYSNTFHDMRLHLGIDIIAESGTAVTACGDGTVSNIYSDAILGTIVEIDHGNGIVAKYCGMGENLMVSINDTVTVAQEIGTVGSVPGESADTPHLHFEMTKSGKIVSPLDTMNIE